MQINEQQMQKYTNLNRIIIAIAACYVKLICPKALKFILVERMEIEFCWGMNKVEAATAYLTTFSFSYELHSK